MPRNRLEARTGRNLGRGLRCGHRAGIAGGVFPLRFTLLDAPTLAGLRKHEEQFIASA